MVITKLFPSLTTLSAFQTPALSCRHNWPDLTNTAVSLDPEAKNVAHNRYNKECNVATPATHISIGGSPHKEAWPYHPLYSTLSVPRSFPLNLLESHVPPPPHNFG